MYVPPGFGTVAPYIFSEQAERLIRFLIEGLGGTESCRTMRGEEVANCQVAIGTTTLMVSQASEAKPPSRASFYVYVEDADASVMRALDAGGRLLMQVADMPYGDRQGGIADPSENTWWISQRLVRAPYSA